MTERTRGGQSGRKDAVFYIGVMADAMWRRRETAYPLVDWVISGGERM